MNFNIRRAALNYQRRAQEFRRNPSGNNMVRMLESLEWYWFCRYRRGPIR
jgi:hypothetical protein